MSPPFPPFRGTFCWSGLPFLEIIAIKYTLIMKVHDVALLPWL
jgi:hypothetical protein